MDEHAQRICEPLVAAWRDVEQGRATLLDLSRLAEQVSDALDHASAPLPQLLRHAGGDLEFAYYAIESKARSVGKRIMAAMTAFNSPREVFDKESGRLAVNT